MKFQSDVKKMIQLAKETGLKRLKIGSLEVELSDYELALLYAHKLQTGPETLTSDDNVLNTPPPGSEAKDTTKTLLDSLAPTEADLEDEDLLYLSAT